MGEAKARKLQIEATKRLLQEVDFPRLAGAVRRLSEAASEDLGSDCVLQAWLSQKLLDRLGVTSRISIGFALWRVGGGDGDVIVHSPMPGQHFESLDRLPYHAWVEVDDHIFDATTAQLRLKGQMLDALDGGETKVDWAPDFLLVEKRLVSSRSNVQNAPGPGVFHYERQPTVERFILSGFAPDEGDADIAWILYCNPEAQVLLANSRHMDRSAA